MSATQNGFATRDDWRAGHGVVPEMPEPLAPSARAKSRDPAEVTLKITQRDPSTSARDDRLTYLAQRASRGPGLDKFAPAQIISTGLMLARFANRHLRDCLDHPFEVRLTNGHDFSIRRGITKIDRDRNAIADGELDGVQVVAEVLIQLQDTALDILQYFLWGLPLGLISQMIRMPRIVGHDPHIAL